MERMTPGPLVPLDTHELRAAQASTLASPRRRYSPAARALFAGLDAIYGRERSLGKCKVLELVARVPYQAWEQVAYIAITHVSSDADKAARIFERVEESRREQDNEQWHLLVLQDLTHDLHQTEHTGFLRFGLVPQLLAFVYYQLSWLLYVVRPAWSYALNADFEDHAEHEYMEMVADHPEWETMPYDPRPSDDAPRDVPRTLADLFRQVGHDERVHKERSLARRHEPRFR